MRYAIVESGGKQYRAVVGETIDVDRLPNEAGSQIKFERVLFVADDADVRVGTPTVSAVEVGATVLNHVRGRKVTHFRYSPKKRIRVRGGHRAQVTRLKVDFIGGPGEERKSKASVAEASEPSVAAGAPKVSPAATATKAPAKKAASKKMATSKSAVKRARK